MKSVQERHQHVHLDILTTMASIEILSQLNLPDLPWWTDDAEENLLFKVFKHTIPIFPRVLDIEIPRESVFAFCEAYAELNGGNLEYTKVLNIDRSYDSVHTGSLAGMQQYIEELGGSSIDLSSIEEIKKGFPELKQ